MSHTDAHRISIERAIAQQLHVDHAKARARRALILEMRAFGLSAKQIAGHFMITPQQVYYLLRKARLDHEVPKMNDQPKQPLPSMRVPPPDTFMTQWVIFEHPQDHPDDYVLRAFYIMKGGALFVDNVAWKAKTVDELRQLIPAGLYKLRRFEQDDAAIVEVWL
jgi:DNA-binding CsgD family transcriptional regulator